MKTDELINMLSQDSDVRFRFGTIMVSALVAAVLLAGLLFFAAMGARPDFYEALESVRFLFKFVITLALFLAAANLMSRMARPGVPILFSRAVVLAVPMLLAFAVLAELAAVRPADWALNMIGRNAYECLTLIPLLSIGPLAAFLLALRQGAPADPGKAGAVAGLAAGGIAAAFYAANCTDDSPLFVALWYTLAIGIVTGAGYLAGRRWLVW